MLTMEIIILLMIFFIYNLMHIHECLFCFGTYNFCDDGKH